jgi:hypothetical protein
MRFRCEEFAAVFGDAVAGGTVDRFSVTFFAVGGSVGSTTAAPTRVGERSEPAEVEVPAGSTGSGVVRHGRLGRRGVPSADAVGT